MPGPGTEARVLAAVVLELGEQLGILAAQRPGPLEEDLGRHREELRLIRRA
jgi:hypothetical protein